MLEPVSLDRALTALGEVLAARGQAFELVSVGGGSLILMGLLERPTRDVDIVAVIVAGRYEKAKPLPVDLARAVVDVGEALGIGGEWLNAGPTDLIDFGLPPGFTERVQTRRYGALILHLASRLDQVYLKLYAAVDQGPRSRHFEDLLLLSPKPDELLAGAAWTLTHDPSPGFKAQLLLALAALGVSDAGSKL
jgi:hypothetical protein